MKFFHLADLHLGKRYNEFSLIDDQRYILNQVLEAAKTERPDAVVIAGDIYDKSVPSAEAVELFDWFLNGLNELKISVLAVSGNHDSAERIAFGASLMRVSGVHFSPVYSGALQSVTFTDGYGEVTFYLLPFIKPATVRRFFEGEEVTTYNDAASLALKGSPVNPNQRNVLVAHQFVTGSQSSGSEEFIVGDVGNVDCSVFSAFDYVALGHVHGAQNVGSERVRYSGTPLKYSLSEIKNQKSITVVELKEKGDITVRTLDLKPLREMVEIRGNYEQLTQKKFYERTTLSTGLVHAVLTDEEEVPDALGKLRLIYRNLVSLKYDNARTRSNNFEEMKEDGQSRSPIELFASLYLAQNNAEMTDKQSALVNELIESIWGEEE